MTNILVAPTEPQWLKSLGRVSPATERYGADVLILPYRAGIQRKEFGDLVSSVHDGRLQKEVQQLARLPYPILIVEGRGRWTTDGALLGYGSFSRQQFNGLLLSIQLRGVWVLHTDTGADTAEAVLEIEKWLGRAEHVSLNRKPKERSVWGKPTATDFASHVIQSLPGCGPTRAAAIVAKFGMPLRWTVTAEELATVDGIGLRTANSLIGALNG